MSWLFTNIHAYCNIELLNVTQPISPAFTAQETDRAEKKEKRNSKGLKRK